jgi:hypothetical protein
MGEEEMFKPGWLREQCEKAKKDVEAWPQWMKDAAKQSGMLDHLTREVPVTNTCRHCGHKLPCLCWPL